MTIPAHHEHAISRSALLRSRAKAFCDAFLDLPNNPPSKILSDHFTPDSPRITEHGPEWATSRLPFLHHTFSGVPSCLEYFSLLSKTLSFQPLEDTFPGPGGFVVDDGAVGPEDDADAWGNGSGVVSLVGKGRFESVETGKAWEEVFVWRLSGFDEDGKVGHWEIWADPLSAWVAVGGKEEESEMVRR